MPDWNEIKIRKMYSYVPLRGSNKYKKNQSSWNSARPGGALDKAYDRKMRKHTTHQPGDQFEQIQKEFWVLGPPPAT